MHKCVRSFLSVAPKWSITEPSQTIVMTLRIRSDQAFTSFTRIFSQQVLFNLFWNYSSSFRMLYSCVWLDFQACVSRKSSRLTPPAEFSDRSAASSHTGPTPGRWSVMPACDSGVSEPSCPALSSWRQTTSPVLLDRQVLPPLTSHPDINRTACHLLARFSWRNPSYYLFIAEMRS